MSALRTKIGPLFWDLVFEGHREWWGGRRRFGSLEPRTGVGRVDVPVGAGLCIGWPGREEVERRGGGAEQGDARGAARQEWQMSPAR